MKNLNLKKMKTIACFCLIYLLIISTGCKPEPTPKVQPDTIFYRLSDYQLSKTPYFKNPAFDTLTFLSNNNDTLIFVKMKTDSLWNIIVNNPNPSHPGIFSYYQTLRNTYQTIKGNGKFEVRHVLNDGNRINTIQIDFNEYTYGIGDWQVGLPEFVGFIGDFEINNKQYKNVARLGNKGSLSYLNSDYGLFFIDAIPNQTNFILIK